MWGAVRLSVGVLLQQRSPGRGLLFQRPDQAPAWSATQHPLPQPVLQQVSGFHRSRFFQRLNLSSLSLPLHLSLQAHMEKIVQIQRSLPLDVINNRWSSSSQNSEKYITTLVQ